jgi:hypothetical protein
MIKLISFIKKIEEIYYNTLLIVVGSIVQKIVVSVVKWDEVMFLREFFIRKMFLEEISNIQISPTLLVLLRVKDQVWR